MKIKNIFRYDRRSITELVKSFKENNNGSKLFTIVGYINPNNIFVNIIITLKGNSYHNYINCLDNNIDTSECINNKIQIINIEKKGYSTVKKFNCINKRQLELSYHCNTKYYCKNHCEYFENCLFHIKLNEILITESRQSLFEILPKETNTFIIKYYGIIDLNFIDNSLFKSISETIEDKIFLQMFESIFLRYSK